MTCQIELVFSVPIFDADMFWAFANNFSVTKAAEERSVRGGRVVSEGMLNVHETISKHRGHWCS